MNENDRVPRRPKGKLHFCGYRIELMVGGEWIELFDPPTLVEEDLLPRERRIIDPDTVMRAVPVYEGDPVIVEPVTRGE